MIRDDLTATMFRKFWLAAVAAVALCGLAGVEGFPRKSSTRSEVIINQTTKGAQQTRKSQKIAGNGKLFRVERSNAKKSTKREICTAIRVSSDGIGMGRKESE